MNLPIISTWARRLLRAFDATEGRTTLGIGSYALLTANQSAALAGTSGTPSSTNKFVTNDDTRMSDARTPTAHAHSLDDVTDPDSDKVFSCQGNSVSFSFDSTADWLETRNTSGAGGPKASLHLRNAAADTGGGWFGATGNQMWMGAGAYYDGSNWIAGATSLSNQILTGGIISWGIITGLTIGNSYAGATERARLDVVDSKARLSVVGKLNLDDMTVSTPADGDVWNDTTMKCQMVHEAGIQQADTRTLFTLGASIGPNNTSAETSLIDGTGAGSLSLPADFWTDGKTIRIRAVGSASQPGSPINETILLKLGSTTLRTLGAGLILNGATHWIIEATITCRTVGSSGSVTAEVSAYPSGSGSVGKANVDTTVAMDIDLTAQFASADVSAWISCQIATVEVLD